MRDFGFDRNDLASHLVTLKVDYDVDAGLARFGNGCRPCPGNDISSSLPSANVTSTTPSIFGVDPLEEGFLLESKDAFECWKGWTKVSHIFFRGCDDDEEEDIPAAERLVHGPTFLRAARMWKAIYQWCANAERAGDSVGATVLASLRTKAGMRYKDWPKEVQTKRGLRACQAVYAFFGGQYHHSYDMTSMFDGVLGGYNAYGYYSSTSLEKPMVMSARNAVVVAICRLSIRQGLQKLYYVDFDTGGLYFPSDDAPIHLVNTNNNSTDSNSLRPDPDEFLLWMEEYANRLTSGRYRVNDALDTDPNAIELYPNFPFDEPPVVTEGIQEVSRAVTRGVEVIASAVFVPQARLRFGYIYSIRIRLLDRANEVGYLSEAERGFRCCQLVSRHWRITDDSTGETDQIDGEGVIGMYPILKEGSFIVDDTVTHGTFRYQSCTGRVSRGSFCGHLRFVPGTIQNPTGRPFNVELRPFVLDDRPAYLY